MVEGFLVVSLMSMFYSTGSVPQPMTSAAYNQLETQRYVDSFQNRYFSNEIKLYGGNVVAIMNAIYRQKIEYRIEF